MQNSTMCLLSFKITIYTVGKHLLLVIRTTVRSLQSNDQLLFVNYVDFFFLFNFLPFLIPSYSFFSISIASLFFFSFIIISFIPVLSVSLLLHHFIRSGIFFWPKFIFNIITKLKSLNFKQNTLKKKTHSRRNIIFCVGFLKIIFIKILS